MHQILTKRVIQSETTLHLVYPEGHQNKIKQVTSQYRNTKSTTPREPRSGPMIYHEGLTRSNDGIFWLEKAQMGSHRGNTNKNNESRIITARTSHKSCRFTKQHQNIWRRSPRPHGNSIQTKNPREYIPTNCRG